MKSLIISKHKPSYVFTALKDILPYETAAQQIVCELQEIVDAEQPMENGAEVLLTTLQNIFLEEISPLRHIQIGIMLLVDSRELSDHPIAVSC